MTETKHTRYSPNVGDSARIAGEDPQAIYTVEGFQSKGKRTTLAILRSDILNLRREVAVSNLLPPIKRMPRTQPTPKDLAEEASAAAWAEPNKRSHEKAAAAWLRVAGGVRNGKPIQRSTASKKARGSMVRWMAENKLEDASELTAFNIGYRHIPELSDENTLVFMNAQAQ